METTADTREVIIVPKKVKDYKCPMCLQMVDVNLGKPEIVETERLILHTWNYGHQHKNMFQIQKVGDSQLVIPISE